MSYNYEVATQRGLGRKRAQFIPSLVELDMRDYMVLLVALTCSKAYDLQSLFNQKQFLDRVRDRPEILWVMILEAFASYCSFRYCAE